MVVAQRVMFAEPGRARRRCRDIGWLAIRSLFAGHYGSFRKLGGIEGQGMARGDGFVTGDLVSE